MSREAKPVICLIGLGQMGIPVATRWLSAGYSVVGVDPNPEARARLEEIGGHPVEHPDQATANVVATLLPNGKIVREALLGTHGFLSRNEPPSLVIEMSSSAPSDTVLLGRELDGLGIALVDAPVSGGVKRALVGQLTVMLGGLPAPCANAAHILQAVATGIHHTGPLGSAHAMKAINNFVSASGTAAASEALIVGACYGINPETMIDILNGSSGRNNATEVKMKQFVLSGTFASGFALGLMAKDVGIAADMAKSVDLNLPILRSVATIWRDAATQLGDRADHTEIFRYLNELSGEAQQ